MKPALLVVLFSIALGLSYWLSQDSEKGKQANNYADNTDYDITTLHLTQYHIDGTIKQTITAKQVEHFTRDGSTQLIQPDMTIFSRDSKNPWNIKSDTALINNDQTELQLNGSVTLHQASYKDALETNIATENLTVYPKQEYAESKALLKATIGSHRLTAKGIKLWYGEQRKIKLLSDVKAHYEVN